jgi:hypothetical protein
MMTAKEFTEKLRRTATEAKTYYLMGGFGQRLMSGDPDWYNKDYQYNKDHAKEINAHKDTTPLTFGFDCVCLLKSVGLWHFEADPSKPFGGAVYDSATDWTIERISKQCADLTQDFTKDLEPGEFVFLEGWGHVGAYIGDGLVVECTPAWKNGVQITGCANLSKDYDLSGYPLRKWTYHGHSAWIDYTKADEGVDWEQAYRVLSEAYGDLEAECGRASRELAALREQNDELAAKIEAMKQTAASDIAEAVAAATASAAAELNKAKKEAAEAKAKAEKATENAQKLAEELETVKTCLGAAKALVARYKALRGDMNGDGKVNAKDALYLYKHTIAPDRYPLADIEEIET